jgi:hypothetical protein
MLYAVAHLTAADNGMQQKIIQKVAADARKVLTTINAALERYVEARALRSYYVG